MKKCIILFTSVLLLSACATVQQPKIVWPGQNFDNYVTANGVPTSQYTLQNGNTAFSFKKTCYYDSANTGETLVIVGKDNIIESVSTPTKCPSYYDSNQYKLDQIYQRQQNEYYEQQQRRRIEESQRKDRIKTLEGAVKGSEMNISVQQTFVELAELDIDFYTSKKDAANVAKAKESLKKAQDELTKYNNLKAQYERELSQLKSMQYK